MRDTIYALSSGPAPAGVAVIRISGPAAESVLSDLCGGLKTPSPRQAVLRLLQDRTAEAEEGRVLDQALVIWFPQPASFTGEDVVELHCHGGAATIAAILACLSRQPDCRLADPGEFSRRAFANGHLDLTEAEALSDLIQAETETQRRLALRLATGAGRDRYQDWTQRLIRVLAVIEAAVDFPEDDLPDGMLERNEIEIRCLIDEFQQDMDLGALSHGIRDGVRITILGAPNVGKSSLLNRLAGREAAIVSHRAGTTRDVIEVRLDLGGFVVVLSDTAGLRETEDDIEEEGVQRALKAADTADLILWLEELPDINTVKRDSIRTLPASLSDRAEDVLTVHTKRDLWPHSASPETFKSDPDISFHTVSTLTGEGLNELLSHISTLCSDRYGRAAQAVAVRTRHRDALGRAVIALNQSLEQPELALSGEDVRVSLTELGRITGRVDVESVLNVVFAEFCIGK